MTSPSTPPSFPGALPEAFEELRTVVEARAPGGWARVLETLSSAARAAAVESTEAAADVEWVEALDAAEALIGNGTGSVARAVGAARADARLRELGDRYDGDPLGFLRAEAASFYRGRATYGAASVELAARRATLRLVASTGWLRRRDGRPSAAPLVALGFFDRALERLAGSELHGRYVGYARRADALGGVELWNLLYEYPLEDQ
jgi:hypothetical protein